MKKTLNTHGTNTFHSEVTNISAFGFWLLVEDREYFIPFEFYPDFKKALVEQILSFEQISPTQFHWPDLEIDIELDALEEPERFHLVFKK